VRIYVARESVGDANFCNWVRVHAGELERNLTIDSQTPLNRQCRSQLSFSCVRSDGNGNFFAFIVKTRFAPAGSETLAVLAIETPTYFPS
jgi:hypothetical protein